MPSLIDIDYVPSTALLTHWPRDYENCVGRNLLL